MSTNLLTRRSWGKLQKELIDYVEEYINKTEFNVLIENQEIDMKNKPEKNLIELTKEDYFDLTVNGAMEFDSNHPYFNDEVFYKELFEYFKDEELYEKCSELLKIKKSPVKQDS